MDVQGYLRALRNGWWLIVVGVVLGAGLAALYVARATPVYQAKVGFYVSSSSSVTSQSVDQALQDRAQSYADLATSDRLAGMIQKSEHLGLSAQAIASRMSGAAQLNTSLFTLTIHDAVPARAFAIATGAAKQFPVLAQALDGASAGSPSAMAVHVVSGPQVGRTPVSPRKTLDLIAGVAAGLLLGLLAAVLRELLDTAVRSSEDLAELIDRPVLGQITFDKAALRSPLYVDGPSGYRRSEEFRQLRTNISFLDAAEPLGVVTVTSCLDLEGKSSIAANLAVVSAEAGTRVLLIGADLRRPRLSSYLGLDDSSGLTNVLAGQVEVDDVLQPWGDGTLTVLASGPLPPNPSELLGSKRMVDLLATLRTRFDLIIIDTPPLLPVADARVVSRHADGVLIVVRYGKARRNHLLQAMRDLATVDARVLGTVFNMRPPRGADSPYLRSAYFNQQGAPHLSVPGGPDAAYVPEHRVDDPAAGRAAGPAEDEADPGVTPADAPAVGPGDRDGRRSGRRRPGRSAARRAATIDQDGRHELTEPGAGAEAGADAVLREG